MSKGRKQTTPDGLNDEEFDNFMNQVDIQSYFKLIILLRYFYWFKTCNPLIESPISYLTSTMYILQSMSEDDSTIDTGRIARYLDSPKPRKSRLLDISDEDEDGSDGGTIFTKLCIINIYN